MKTGRILLILPRGASGTGSGTYSGILAEGLRNVDELEIRCYTSPADLEENWDVVHAVDLKHLDPDIVPLIRAPLVADVHDAYWLRGEQRFLSPDLPVRLYLAAMRRYRYGSVLRRASALIAHSEYVASRLAHPCIHVVRYAIESLDPGPPLADRPPHVVFAGRDYFRKGLPVLIRAWRHAGALRPDATLYIAGREFPHGRLYARAAALRSSVEWLGDYPREALLEKVRNARALVLPSWTEAFGIVLIEAAALGTPAVATRAGGMPEALQDGRSGILIEAGDSRAVARAILRCLNTEPDRELIDMTTRAKEAAASYSVDNLVEGILRIYGEVKGK